MTTRRGRAASTALALALAAAACGGGTSPVPSSTGPTSAGATTSSAGGGGGGATSSATGGGGSEVGPVVINEVTSSLDDDVELFNLSDARVDISGWVLADSTPELPGHTYTIPAGTTLAPGAYEVLAKGVDQPFGLGFEDTVSLADADGAAIDAVTWAAGQAVISYCRVPNGTGPFTACSAATFGTVNAP